MAPQTVTASQHGIYKAEAIRRELGLTQADLAEKSGASRAVVINFLKGRPVRIDVFKQIANALAPETAWTDFTQLVKPITTLSIAPKHNNEIEIDVVTHKLRQYVASEIQKRCGLVKVLGMTQPIDSTRIYTDVNILERGARPARVNLRQLMQVMSAENLDRCSSGNIEERRISGLGAIRRYHFLMILGRPGAGKTTFLKRLAMWCSSGKHGLEGKVPFFVELRELSHTHQKYDVLSEYLLDSYSLQASAVELEQLLEAGRALILLDGLDEVQNTERQRVQTAIRDFGRKYDQNQIVITSRIAAQQYIFEQFTEVELANFNDSQIQDFANQWFLLYYPDSERKNIMGKLFWEDLNQQKVYKELATKPLLLTLLCIVFSEYGGLPISKASLCEEALTILLSKWDKMRQIEREQVYEGLSVVQEKALLAKLAWVTFERGEYFFKEEKAKQEIQIFLKSLPNKAIDYAEGLFIDSGAVLDLMEAHHGLLVKQAMGIYSFSHLAFQEFLAASFVINDEKLQRSLIEKHMYDQRWREVFSFVVEMLASANSFLLAMKEKNEDFLVSHHSKSKSEHKEILDKYNMGNQLIIDCLNSECYVSREVRQHIEEALLVPPD